MPDAAVTSQLDRSPLWEHMCAGDMQHDGAEQRAEARGCKWETTPKQSPFQFLGAVLPFLAHGSFYLLLSIFPLSLHMHTHFCG